MASTCPARQRMSLQRQLGRDRHRELRFSPGRSPRSPATSPAQYPAGSGVGVNVLVRQPHGFEGFALGRSSADRRDPAARSVIRRRHGRSSAATAAAAGPAKCATRLAALRRRELGDRRRAGRPRLSGDPSMTARAARHTGRARDDSPRPFESGQRSATAARSPALNASKDVAQISTFSCDIARAVSRRLRSRRERPAPTAPWLRELRPGWGRCADRDNFPAPPPAACQIVSSRAPCWSRRDR